MKLGTYIVCGSENKEQLGRVGKSQKTLASVRITDKHGVPAPCFVRLLIELAI